MHVSCPDGHGPVVPKHLLGGAVADRGGHAHQLLPQGDLLVQVNLRMISDLAMHA